MSGRSWRGRDRSEGSLGEAIERNLVEIHQMYGHLPGAWLVDEADLMAFSTGLPAAVFNGVVRARFAHVDAELQIRELVEHFVRRGAPWRWITTPLTRPVDLPNHLERLGLIRHRDHPAMVAYLPDVEELRGEHAMPPALAIDIVADDAGLEAWLEVQRLTWHHSAVISGAWREAHGALGLGPDRPLRHYVVRLDGTPVGASTSMFGTDAVGLYNVSTLPEWRGRGYGRAVTIRSLRDARDDGYEVAVLAASDLGFPVYHRLGFAEVGRIGVFTAPEAQPAS